MHTILAVYRYPLVQIGVQKDTSQWLSEYSTIRSTKPQILDRTCLANLYAWYPKANSRHGDLVSIDGHDFTEWGAADLDGYVSHVSSVPSRGCKNIYLVQSPQ